MEGPETATAGFNQGFLGPTIVVANGSLAARIENAWGEAVSVHWHGLIVPGEHDGGPHSAIEPQRLWQPEIEVNQRPALLWYHSHIHGRTARHVHSGLVGAIQVTDGRDDERGLPSTYGVDDLTLILQDRRRDQVGGMAYEPRPTDVLNGFHGNRMFVNGQAAAVAVVPPGIARLRFVNGSNARTYGLAFDDRRPMHLVGTDGGLLPAPQALTFLRLAPGERSEVLVDFADGGASRIVNTRANDARVLDFAADATQRPRITKLPGAVGDALPSLPEPAVTREFALTSAERRSASRTPGPAATRTRMVVRSILASMGALTTWSGSTSRYRSGRSSGGS
jgi:FtsP/CotA-like multicopper oxidase with cupredoxin domain